MWTLQSDKQNQVLFFITYKACKNFIVDMLIVALFLFIKIVPTVNSLLSHVLEIDHTIFFEAVS